MVGSGAGATLSPYEATVGVGCGWIILGDSKFQIPTVSFFILNSLLADGREEDALKWVPREVPGFVGDLGAVLYGRDENNRFVLVVDADGDMWEEDWPVFLIGSESAESLLPLEIQAIGLPYRLPSEVEWGKVGVGLMVDFVWGDGFDPSDAI